MGYNTIPDAELNVDKPVLFSTMRKLRDNMIAIAGGEVGAPRIENDALASPSVGVGDAYVAVGSRVVGTSYRNTTGQAILVTVTMKENGTGSMSLQWSANGTTWVTVALAGSTTALCGTVFVSDDEYYRVLSAGGGATPSIQHWAERRI